MGRFRASNEANDQIALQNEQCPISGHPTYTYLKAGNFDQLEVKRTEPDIEDCFIALMKEG